MRFDQYIASHLGISRNKAQYLIESGLVFLSGTVTTKVSQVVRGDEPIEIQDDPRVRWVSRSAKKLASFLDTHPEIPIEGKRALDIGASTGGFTQVLLEHGITQVDAVEVGRDQLHPSLREDPRVRSHEMTDIRKFIPIHPPPWYDIIVCDASFVSLTNLLDTVLKLATPETDIILLWKPQFEVSPKELGKTGVPKSASHVEKVQGEWKNILIANNCNILDVEKSALLGEAGNQEWIYWIKR